MDDGVVRNDKYQIAILIIVVVFILLVVFALIFRHVDLDGNNKNSVSTVLTDGDLAIDYIDGQNVNAKGNKEHSYGISITNTSNSKIYYSIYFIDINRNEASVVIEDYDGKVLNTLEEDLDYKKLINLQVIEPNTTLRFVVKIKAINGNNFKGKLLVVNESLSSDSFADLLLATYEIGSSKTRVGSEISTINEGLLKSTDNKGVSYYFRGAIDYNYVKLGNNLFRIVRINGDGSVRIVLDNVLPDKVEYNTTVPQDNVSSADLASLKNASILNTLNQWYSSNLGEYKKYIVNSDFCTDTHFNISLNNIYYSNGYDRIFVDDTPDLYCTGTIYSGPVGLLTADEIALAGAYRSVANDKYYLYNNDIKGSYVTISSYSLSSGILHMINVTANGAFGDSVVASEKVSIRPVISIGANAKIRGDGSKENPYIIVA